MSDVLDEQMLYEIIELPSGEIALCRAGDEGPEGEPLVKLAFSEESRFFLGDGYAEVAKAMIEAGLEAVQDMQQEQEDEPDEPNIVSHLVH